MAVGSSNASKGDAKSKDEIKALEQNRSARLNIIDQLCYKTN
jgi:hypothetical protein